METKTDSTKLSEQAREALEKLPTEKRAKAEAVIAKTQTPESRAKDTAERAALERECRQTGRIATVSEKATTEGVTPSRAD
jgi:hypothetical protein